MCQLEFMTEVLSDYCTVEKLPFMSASDILALYHSILTESQREWLRNYIEIWDVIQENENQSYGSVDARPIFLTSI